VIDLKATWAAFVEPAHLDWTYRLLFSLYEGEARPYHNLRHVGACVRLLRQYPFSRPAVDAVTLALLWHDAVYQPGDKRNEDLSARLLASLWPVLSCDAGCLDRAVAAIHATRHHDAAFLDNFDSELVVDIDIAILGTSWDRYDLYRHAIREEFRGVSDEAWRMGRGAFLGGMLARKRIFWTAWAHDNGWERQARANMARELRLLEARP